QRMTRGEEIDQLVLDRCLAIERAHERGSAGNAGQAVYERFVAELERVSTSSSRPLNAEPEASADAGHDPLVQCLEVRWDPCQDAGSQIGAVRVAMQLLVGSF